MTRTLAILALYGASLVASVELSSSMVPSQCTAICGPVVQLTSICDLTSSNSTNNTAASSNPMMTDTNMQLEKFNPMAAMAADTKGAIMMEAGAKMKKRQNFTPEEVAAEDTCFCKNKSFDVAKVMGLCASCMGMNAGSANKAAVQNADAYMSACAFSSTSYAPSATTILAEVSVQATKPVLPTTTTAAATSSMPPNQAVAWPDAAGRVEVFTSLWSVGMVMASIGLGAGLLVGML